MQARALQQPLEGIKAIGGVVGGAVVVYVVYVFASVIHSDARARAPGGYGGVVANDWISIGLDTVLPATFIFLTLFGLIASGVFARRYA